MQQDEETYRPRLPGISPEMKVLLIKDNPAGKGYVKELTEKSMGPGSNLVIQPDSRIESGKVGSSSSGVTGTGSRESRSVVQGIHDTLRHEGPGEHGS